VADEASTSEFFERREGSRKLNLKVLRNSNRVSVDRNGAARVVGTITGSCAVKSTIKNEWFNCCLSCCTRAQQRNREEFESSRKHDEDECEFESMEYLLWPKMSGFIFILPPLGTV
jgi:hypothetical protein